MDTEWAILTLKACISNILRPAKHLLCIESKQTLTFQMVKFSITVKQIPGTQARLPENPTDDGQKPLCLCGNQQQRPGLQNLILQMSQPWSCLSLNIQLFASFMLPLLTAAQPESCYTLGDAPPVPSLARKDDGTSCHDWHHPGAQARGGQMSLASRALVFANLPTGQGWAQGRGGKCIECIESSDIHWVAGMFHGTQIRPYTEVYKMKAPKYWACSLSQKQQFNGHGKKKKSVPRSEVNIFCLYFNTSFLSRMLRH